MCVYNHLIGICLIPTEDQRNNPSSDSVMAKIINCYIPVYTDSPTTLGATTRGQSLYLLVDCTTSPYDD